jgi:putative nucleotidyltransferase-like protein
MTYWTYETLRTEQQLLLSAISPDRTPENDDRIRSCASKSLDWDYLFVFARRHGVLQLLYSQLQQCATDLIPSNQLQCLQKYFQENSARNVLLTAELRRLIDLLESANIEAVPYKGPVLALFAYGDVSLRRFVDLDVLVRKEDVSRAIDLLLTDGYEFSKPLSLSQRDLLLRTQHNLQLRRDERQLIVELHWEVASNLFASSVQADDLWSSLSEIKLSQTNIKTLAVEDLMFSLCVHGSRHLWERLLWICDIGWIVARHQVNWSKLLDRARSTQSERMFLLGLYLSGKLLGVRFPDLVHREFESDAALDVLASGLLKALFGREEHVPATRGEIFRYNWQVRKHWSARARYLRYAMNPTDRDMDAMTLPRALSFGYYVTRPIRLLFKGPQ